MSEDTREAIDRLGQEIVQLHQQGQYTQAIPLATQACDLARQYFGGNHSLFAATLNNLAALYMATSNYAAAEPLLQQALAIRRISLGENHPDVAQSLNNLADLYRIMGNYTVAGPLYEEALEIGRIALGEHHPDVATYQNNLALFYKVRGQYAEAERLYQQALATKRTLLGNHHPDVATSLDNLAELLRAMGHYTAAEPLYQQALTIRRSALGEQHPAFATSLHNLAGLYEALGNYARAEQYARQALEVWHLALGEQHLTFATGLHNLAALTKALGNYSEAEKLYQQALAIKRTTLGEAHPSIANSLHNLAALYEAMGRYVESEQLYQEALEIRRTVLGNNHPSIATTLHNLAELYKSMGKYADAEPLYQHALESRRTVLGQDHPDLAASFNSLASLYDAMGDHIRAELFYQQALKICLTALGEHHPNYAASLQNLAGLYHRLARYAEAERLYLQALDIWKATIGGNHPDCATTLHNLAGLYSTTGEYTAAERLYHQALGIERAVLGERHPDYAASLHNLALLYHTKGDYPQAERLYQQALEIWRAVLGDNHRNCASCLNNFAVLYVATGREPQAMRLMNEATLIDDQMLQQVFSIGSESQRMAYLHDLREHADVFLSLACIHMSQTDAAVHAGLDLVLRRKAIGAEALAAQRDTVLGGRYPALTQHLQVLTTLRMQIAHKTLAGPGPEGLSTHRQLLAAWEARRDRLEAELARHIPEMTLAHRLQTADRRAIAQALPTGIVLVEFVRFDLFDFHAVPARGQTRWQSARYLAFILPAGEPDNVHMIDLGAAEPIDEMIAAFRASITGEAERLAGQPPAAPGPELSHPLTASDGTAADETARFARPTPMTPAQAGYGNEGTALRSALFDPLLTPLGERRRLFLAPDGDLARLPFGVLPMTNGGRLIDEYHISYLSVGRDMLRFGAGLPGHLSKALVVADPDFDLREGNAPSVAALAHPHGRQSRDLNRRALCFTRLAGTRVEGERIAATLGVRPQLGAMALESRLKACRSPRVLHIATHGFFLPDQQSFPHEEQHMLAAGGMADGKVERLWGQRLENPLLRSGLALAGANAWLRGGQPPMEAEDGLFTAEDVSGLDLLGTELVVLSACETGLGKVHAGEGVFGLRRTFVLAGAKTLVMSLWKVPDQQTQELMVDFYRRILDGQPRAAALREAQLALKALYPNPFYWGAFICQGDPGPLRDSTNPCCRG